jgi:uncharacterized lipoprotein YddW (UPF0748 family)
VLAGDRGRWHRVGTLGAFVGAAFLVTSCQIVGAAAGGGTPPAPSGAADAVVSERQPSSSGVPANRGLWVVRTTLTHPDSVRAMVRRAADAGFNTLLVQVRGRADSYFSNGIEPRADALKARPDFDPLALTLQEAHRRGIEVHAWMNVHLVSSALRLSTDPGHLVNERPDLLAVPRELAGELNVLDPKDPRFLDRLRRHADENRIRVEGLYSSPSSPEVKERVYSVAMDLVDRYDIDGLHMDYVRYPSGEYDYSRGALSRFRSWVGERVPPGRRAQLDQAALADPLAYANALAGPWAEFRRAQITDLVERIHTGAKRRRPDVLVSAAVFPDPITSYTERYQDWAAWIRDDIVDMVAPMAYTADEERYRELMGKAVEVGGGDRVWAGVGTYLASYQGTVDMIGIARGMGVRGVVLFSYDWAVASGESPDDVPFLRRVGEAGFGR